MKIYGQHLIQIGGDNFLIEKNGNAVSFKKIDVNKIPVHCIDLESTLAMSDDVLRMYALGCQAA